MEDVVILRKGALNCQACVEKGLDDDYITEKVNEIHPCGTELGWVMSKHVDRVQCADEENREHIIFTC